MDIPLRPDQEEHLRALCKEMGRTPEEFAKDAILTFMEDYEDGRAADDAMKNDDGTRISLEEVMKEFGLDDRTFAAHKKTA